MLNDMRHVSDCWFWVIDCVLCVALNRRTRQRSSIRKYASLRVSVVVGREVDAGGCAFSGQSARDNWVSVCGHGDVLFFVLFLESVELAQPDHELVVVGGVVSHEFVLGLGTRRVRG